MKALVKIGMGCLVLCMIGCGGDTDREEAKAPAPFVDFTDKTLVDSWRFGNVPIVVET